VSEETVTITLENLVYHSTEYPFLSDLLEEKYGFVMIEDDTQEVSKEQKPIDHSLEEDENDKTVKAEIKKYSEHKKLSGDYLDANIRVSILGDVASTHMIVEIAPDEQLSNYTTTYQMIRISSSSGYAVQKLIDRLVVDLGLVIPRFEWTFHRVKDL
jgi:outer membrane translocation and assembly module TamA